MIGFGLFMAVLLAGMWLPLVARTATADSVPELAGGTTLVVQAFDLGFLVPLGLFTAAPVHRRHAVGYVLASVVVVKGIAMGCAIAAMLLVEGSATGSFQAPPILGFAGDRARRGRPRGPGLPVDRRCERRSRRPGISPVDRGRPSP